MSPDATVETMSFGHADGEVAHRARRDRGVARAADRRHAVDAPLAVQAGEHRSRAAPHDVHRLAAVGVADEVRVLGARRARDLLAVDVGRDPRLPEDARVDEQHVDPGLAQAVAHERVLVALRVEGAQQHDRGHQPRSTPSQRRCASGSCASSDAVVSAAI